MIPTIHPSPEARRRPGRRWRAGAAAVVLALAPLGLAACGGDDDASAAADSNGAASSSDMEAFQQCLAENGVEMGAPPSQDGSGGSGASGGGTQGSMPDREAMQKAQEACADLMPEGMGQGGPGMGPGGGSEELQAYTECLSENGVEVQGPGSGGGEPPSDQAPSDGSDGSDGADRQPPSGSMFGLDSSDPEVAAAMEACADLEPSMPSGGQGGPGAQSDSADGSTESS